MGTWSGRIGGCCLALIAAGTAAAQSSPGTAGAIRHDLSVLAADSMAGRWTGSHEADEVAAYLVGRFAAAGARPGVPGWRQRFEIAAGAPALRTVADSARPDHGVNVVAMIPGRDPALRDEVVVVGAHYDHLGRFGRGMVLDPDQVGAVHNGADDNASGAVALVEIARLLAAAPPRRSVVLVAFAGEELGLLGSAAYVASPAVPMDRTYAMINLDMVGRLRNDHLLVFGSETATELPSLLESLNRTAKFDLAASGDGYGRSDHQSFYLAKKPVLHLFTDLHDDYHRATDDWDKINVPGLLRVARFGADLTRALGDRTAALTFVDRPPPPPPAAAGRESGYGAYLGSIPDMASAGPGVRLSGVRSGSPADQAGLREGDVLLRIGTVEVPDLQGMVAALRAHRAGDTATVVFRRGQVVDSVQVVFGRRGG
jgi:Peptidase family M28/PDZ domain